MKFYLQLIAVLFLTGTAAATQLTPTCPNPAPLLLTDPCGALGDIYVVLYVQGTDATLVTHQLETKYGFTASSILNPLPAFIAKLTPKQVAQLRCEPLIRDLEGNFALQPGGGGGSGAPCPSRGVPALSTSGIAIFFVAIAYAAVHALRSRY